MTDLENLKKLLHDHVSYWTPDSYVPIDDVGEALDAIERLQRENEQLIGKTRVTMGVGYGSGKLFVHGDYDSIKACQSIIDDRDRLRRELEEARIQLSRKETTIGTVSSALTYAESQASEWRCKAGELDNENRRLKLDLEEARRERDIAKSLANLLLDMPNMSKEQLDEMSSNCRTAIAARQQKG